MFLFLNNINFRSILKKIDFGFLNSSVVYNMASETESYPLPDEFLQVELTRLERKSKYLWDLSQKYTENKIKGINDDSIMREILHQWPMAKKIIDKFPKTVKGDFINDAVCHIDLYCGPPPNAICDWREYPDVTFSIVWAYLLSQTPRDKEYDYKFENFLNGECLEKFKEHPLKREGCRDQWILEALGYMFNSTEETWERSYDYMTPEEIEEHEKYLDDLYKEHISCEDDENSD